MITKDIEHYFRTAYTEHLASITELSKSDKGGSLVKDTRKLYHFDDITKNAYHLKKVPTSADAVLVSDKMIVFVEFKSGFRQNITKKSLDRSKLTCCRDKRIVCDDYGRILLELQKKKRNELIDSIKMKAVESYITLEKKIMPLCMESDSNVRMIYCVVMDSEEVDTTQDILQELAREESEENPITAVRRSLRRFVGNIGADGQTYLYDKVEVFTPYEFKLFLDRNIRIVT